jgi:hypothetical protein
VANSKPSFVPPIDPSLLAHVHTPDDWLLKTAPRSIDHFNRVLDSIPRNYSWQFMSVEAFRRIGSTLDTPAAAYRERRRLCWQRASRVAWLSSLSRRTWVLEATERASLITACQSTVADTSVAITV